MFEKPPFVQDSPEKIRSSDEASPLSNESREKKQHAGGPSAFRADWIQEKFGRDLERGMGLPILAEQTVAKTLRDHYPKATVIDSGLAQLGPFEQKVLGERFPSLEWVIMARDGGEFPQVIVKNIQTGEVLPNDALVMLDESWKNGTNAFVEKINRIKERRKTTG